ncbi:MAG: hypothetical protein WKG32_04630 [Gemmatimonadaceae bacterium]
MTRSFGAAGVGPADGRARFLRAIVEQVPLPRIRELYLFTPIRRGPHETGVAVIAAVQEVGASDTQRGGPPPEGHDDALPPDDHHQSDPYRAATTHDDRLTIYRAHYRWTRKGPERGQWHVEVSAEAEAPLEAVADVVRGVHRRSGDEGEPERLSAAALAAELRSVTQ